jgi:hypothetical protein
MKFSCNALALAPLPVPLAIALVLAATMGGGNRFARLRVLSCRRLADLLRRLARTSATRPVSAPRTSHHHSATHGRARCHAWRTRLPAAGLDSLARQRTRFRAAAGRIRGTPSARHRRSGHPRLSAGGHGHCRALPAPRRPLTAKGRNHSLIPRTPPCPESPRRKFPHRNVVPDALDLRDRPYQPSIAVSPAPTFAPSIALPVLNQDDSSACTGFALASVVHHLQRRREPKAAQVSPWMIYSMARRYDGVSRRRRGHRLQPAWRNEGLVPSRRLRRRPVAGNRHAAGREAGQRRLVAGRRDAAAGVPTTASRHARSPTCTSPSMKRASFTPARSATPAGTRVWV